jgi:NTP pyrophosphatase (non-canonical NTP hydrolase)
MNPATMTPEQLAENIADYMATSAAGWPDHVAMREAVRETVRLLFTEARFDTLKVLGVDALRAKLEEAMLSRKCARLQGERTAEATAGGAIRAYRDALAILEAKGGVVMDQQWIDQLTRLMWPGETLEEAGLALGEEVGEVHRAIVKRNHAARHEGDRPGDVAHWTKNLQQELAAVVIVAAKMANREGFDLLETVSEEVITLEKRAMAMGWDGRRPSVTTPARKAS